MNISCIYTLRQPLSHIGESESTVSFLNTVRVVNNDNVEEVFAYTGNAIRGTLRDCGAKYLLDTIRSTDGNEDFKVSKKMFHILFSGGNITGEQKNDIDQIVQIRKKLPFVSLFGAGIGNQILAGKMAQGFALPICAETTGIIPRWITDNSSYSLDLGWKQLTGTIQFSRKDDLKDVLLNGYAAQVEEEADKSQMRYEVEYVSAGTQLYHEIILDNLTPLELGAFISCIKAWADKPILGGMSSKGFGLTDLNIYDGDTQRKIIKVVDNKISIVDEYHTHLNNYKKFIIENVDDIKTVLGG